MREPSGCCKLASLQRAKRRGSPSGRQCPSISEAAEYLELGPTWGLPRALFSWRSAYLKPACAPRAQPLSPLGTLVESEANTESSALLALLPFSFPCQRRGGDGTLLWVSNFHQKSRWQKFLSKRVSWRKPFQSGAWQ